MLKCVGRTINPDCVRIRVGCTKAWQMWQAHVIMRGYFTLQQKLRHNSKDNSSFVCQRAFSSAALLQQKNLPIKVLHAVRGVGAR